MARNASRFTPYIPLRCRLGGTSNAHCTSVIAPLYYFPVMNSTDLKV